MKIEKIKTILMLLILLLYSYSYVEEKVNYQKLLDHFPDIPEWQNTDTDNINIYQEVLNIIIKSEDTYVKAIGYRLYANKYYNKLLINWNDFTEILNMGLILVENDFSEIGRVIKYDLHFLKSTYYFQSKKYKLLLNLNIEDLEEIKQFPLKDNYYSYESNEINTLYKNTFYNYIIQGYYLNNNIRELENISNKMEKHDKHLTSYSSVNRILSNVYFDENNYEKAEYYKNRELKFDVDNPHVRAQYKAIKNRIKRGKNYREIFKKYKKQAKREILFEKIKKYVLIAIPVILMILILIIIIKKKRKNI